MRACDQNKKNLFPQKEWCKTKLLTRVTVSTYYFPTDDDEEGPTFKDKLLAATFRCIDIFCVWDCCWLWLEFQKYVSLLVFDPFVELFITLCIVVNTLFMALDHHDMDKDMEKVLKTGNYVSVTEREHARKRSTVREKSRYTLLTIGPFSSSRLHSVSKRP